MKVIRGAAGETNRLYGSATGRIGTSGGKARVLRVDQSNLTHELIDPYRQRHTNALGKSLGYGVPGQNPPDFSYRCSSTSLVYSDLVKTYTFERLGR
jgi:hypothetical protein